MSAYFENLVLFLTISIWMCAHGSWYRCRSTNVSNRRLGHLHSTRHLHNMGQVKWPSKKHSTPRKTAGAHIFNLPSYSYFPSWLICGSFYFHSFTLTGKLGFLSITSSAGRIWGLQTWWNLGTDPAPWKWVFYCFASLPLSCTFSEYVWKIQDEILELINYLNATEGSLLHIKSLHSI